MGSIDSGFTWRDRPPVPPARLIFLVLTCLLGTPWLQAAPDRPADTLTGRVLCGYQGWFAAEGDGSGLGWQHYGFRAGTDRCTIDMWPDTTDFAPDELFASPLRRSDGQPAPVFSSGQAKTVRRHFTWMRDHGIDGVFLQRFGAALRGEKSRAFTDRVLGHVRAAAAESGRSWAVMYDLSGLRGAEFEPVVMNDWKRLRNELHVIDDPTYLRHQGRPVVAVWGIGFNDGRAYSLADCAALLRFLRDNPEFGGTTVMAGVPFGWRTLDRDAAPDPQLHATLELAGIVSPWAVGRYATPDEAERQIARVHKDDAAWCETRGKSYLPVIFPGFSWANLTASRGGSAPLDAIPRLGGRFYWTQAMARLRHGSRMLYVAMFDEMDEATAIFKCTNDIPTGTRGFVTSPGLPSDHYLWLTSQISRTLRGEIAVQAEMPGR